MAQLPFEIVEVHFSDNLGQQDEHKPLGYGNLDLKGLLKSLKHNGFNGIFTLEICRDMLNGQYGLDIYDSSQTEGLVSSRQSIIETWAAV